jgi:hydrogenase expression/formation protein HypE
VVIGRYITTVHGSGGFETLEVIERLIVSRVPEDLRRALDGFGLDVLDDGSSIRVGDQHIVLSSDSFTVKPLFFPGGDIGHLAASGVLNDLVMMGAVPVAFMDNIVVEEGFPRDDLDRIIASMINVLRENNVALVGGDFKVMPKNSLDGIIISATGIGLTEKPVIDKVIPGDKIIVTGPIAEHGATILAAQLGMLEEAKGLRSDSKPLVKTVLPIIRKYREYIDAARDPTRGGLAVILNEFVRNTSYMIIIDRGRIPIRDEVREFLDALGIDPLGVASDGVAVLAVKNEYAEEVVYQAQAVLIHKKALHGSKFARVSHFFQFLFSKLVLLQNL